MFGDFLRFHQIFNMMVVDGVNRNFVTKKLPPICNENYYLSSNFFIFSDSSKYFLRNINCRLDMAHKIRTAIFSGLKNIQKLFDSQ